MGSERCSQMTVLISHLLLMVTIFIVSSCSSAEAMADLTVSGTKSSSRDTITSSRHKRAPGWGKRNFERDELFDESESALEEKNNKAMVRAAVILSQEAPISSDKRAPGWGKRAPGWGKRAPGWGKRAPGWGKRSCYDGECFSSVNSIPRKIINDDIVLDDEDEETRNVGRVLFKRAPGWGKRQYSTELDNEAAEKNNRLSFLGESGGASVELFENTENLRELLNRIASVSRATLSSQDIISADKRAPGWGKRNHYIALTEEGTDEDKRAPGWGKRAPGWGKRAPGWGKRNDQSEFDDESPDSDKRAPGWGKRAPGWGKRAPGWGKRSVPDNCQDLQNMKGDFINKVVEGVSGKCGNPGEANKPSRK